MNGPWSDALLAWAEGPAAWGQKDDAPVVAAVGVVGLALAAPAAVAAPLARPTNGPATAALVGLGAQGRAVAAGDGRTALLAASFRPGQGLPWAQGQTSRIALMVGPAPIQATPDVTGLARTADLALGTGICLVGTGGREVARLLSRPTTSTRLVSRICPAVSLASPIDIEQT
ncbi:MAG: hypothetical protein ACLGQH_04355 [Acidobacteriota bacterium]